MNEKAVREAVPAAGRDYQIFDTEAWGFAVCIYRSGSRAFTLDCRSAWRQQRVTIEHWPEWSTTAARERAKDPRHELDPLEHCQSAPSSTQELCGEISKPYLPLIQRTTVSK